MSWSSQYYWKQTTHFEDITHACGHVVTHELFGKRHGGTYAQVLMGRNCTACWKAEKDAERKATPVTCEIAHVGNRVYFSVMAGDTYSIKDALKAVGCRWTEWLPAEAATSEDVDKMLRKVWAVNVPAPDEQTMIGKLMAAGVVKFVERPVPVTA